MKRGGEGSGTDPGGSHLDLPRNSQTKHRPAFLGSRRQNTDPRKCSVAGGKNLEPIILEKAEFDKII